MLGKSSKPQWLKVFYVDLAKPKSGARIVFSPHNLSRPGLEPGSSNSEPSALITGLLNKAVVLACPQYSWPRMSKVAPSTVVRSYNRIFSAGWVTTILYNYGATLCELRYDLKFFFCQKDYFFPTIIVYVSFLVKVRGPDVTNRGQGGIVGNWMSINCR